MGFRTEELFLSFFLEGIKQSLKSVKEVFIYCSSENEEYLKDAIGDLATVKVVDYSLFDFDKRFWNFYKIISLYLSAKEGVPAIHLDLDFKLTKKLSKKALSADVICERRRVFYTPRRDVSNRVPERLKGHIDPYIVCSGLYGASDCKLIIDFFNLTKEIVKVDFSNDEPVTDKVRITMEESMFSALCKVKEKTVYSLKEGDYVHLQGSKKTML
jgi:hypothetical protein